jgi:hypothetical protein
MTFSQASRPTAPPGTMYQISRYRPKQYEQSAGAFQNNIAITNPEFAIYNHAHVYLLAGNKNQLGRVASQDCRKSENDFADS